MAFDLSYPSKLRTPQIRVLSHDGTSAKLQRTNVEYAESYELFQDDVSIGAFADNTIDITGLTQGTEYNWHVVASAGTTDSLPSNKAKIKTFPMLGGIPAPFLQVWKVVDGVATINMSLPSYSGVTFNVYDGATLIATETGFNFTVTLSEGSHSLSATATVGGTTTGSGNVVDLVVSEDGVYVPNVTHTVTGVTDTTIDLSFANLISGASINVTVGGATTTITNSTYQITGQTPESIVNISYTQTVGGQTSSSTAFSVTMDAAVSGVLRAVSQTNAYARISQEYSVYDSYVIQTDHRIGGGAVESLRLGFDTAYMYSSAGTVITPLGNDMDIIKAAVEYNGISVPVTFSGSRSVTVPDATVNFMCDTIPASAFSVAEIPYDATVTVRVLVNPGYSERIGISAVDGRAMNTTAYWFDSATTTVSDIDTAGQTPVLTGPDKLVRNEILSIRLLGEFADDANSASLIARGDSITQGTGDYNGTDGGPGWFFRMRDCFSVKPAMMNLASHGSIALAGLTDPGIIALYDYVNAGVIAYGANDLGSAGDGDINTLTTRVTTIRQQMIDAGCETVGVMALLPRTSSTDSFLTEANQTYTGLWYAGQNPDLYNQSLATSEFDFVIPMDSMRGVDVWKNVTDGMTTRYSSYDGTHPSTDGMIRMSKEAASVFAANYSKLELTDVPPVVTPLVSPTSDTITVRIDGYVGETATLYVDGVLHSTVPTGQVTTVTGLSPSTTYSLTATQTYEGQTSSLSGAVSVTTSAA